MLYVDEATLATRNISYESYGASDLIKNALLRSFLQQFKKMPGQLHTSQRGPHCSILLLIPKVQIEFRFIAKGRSTLHHANLSY